MPCPNEAMGDVQFEAVQRDFSMRSEQDQAVRIGERVAAAMAK